MISIKMCTNNNLKPISPHFFGKSYSNSVTLFRSNFSLCK